MTVKKLDGTEKAYKIAKFKEDLIAQFDAVSPGDNVDIEFREEKGFMNVAGVKKYDGSMTSTPRGNSAGGRGGQDSDKMSKEEWAAKDLVKNRGVALSYALRYGMPAMHDAAQLAEMDYPDYAKAATTIADLLLEYINNGTPTTEGKVEATDADVPTPDTD